MNVLLGIILCKHCEKVEIKVMKTSWQKGNRHLYTLRERELLISEYYTTHNICKQLEELAKTYFSVGKLK